MALRRSADSRILRTEGGLEDGLQFDDNRRHPSQPQTGGGLGGVYTVLFVGVVLLSYVGMYVYHQDVMNRQAGSTQLLVRDLEGSLKHLEGEVKHLAGELAEKRRALEEQGQLLQDKDKDLDTARKGLERAMRKAKNAEDVEKRLSKDEMIKALQKQSRIFNHLRWGEGPARVLFETAHGNFEIETAPFDLMPHSVHYFLTLVETGFFDGCHVIRNAGHVMQLNCMFRSPPHPFRPSVVFQEYAESFPHEAWALGLAGRPGGVDWYINLQDNKKSHGPGGQGPEADPCFGKLVAGQDVVLELHKTLPKEFLSKADSIKIHKAAILPQRSAVVVVGSEATTQ